MEGPSEGERGRGGVGEVVVKGRPRSWKTRGGIGVGRGRRVDGHWVITVRTRGVCTRCN